LTVVADLETGAVVFVGQGKGAKTLDPFWRRLKSSGARVEAVSTDMSKAYLAAVAKHLPQAVHVLDHFHVIKLYNEKLPELRRELYRKAVDASAKKVLKGTRWLLLKNPENLDEDKNELERLAEALALNKELAIAYYLKDDLKQIWLQSNEAAAARVFDDWVKRARGSRIAILAGFADTMVQHRQAILNYYRYRISTAKLEAINGKIQMLKRQARGFRDQEFFILKIHDLHKTKHALVG
jgi:transposase